MLKTINNISNFINSTLEKLSSLLGEKKITQKDIKEENLKEKLFKPLKIVLNLFAQNKNKKEKRKQKDKEKELNDY